VAAARKRFGQHFLHDPAVLERIVRAIEPRAADHFIEVGPGRGALTARLLAAPLATLDAVEIDRDLAAHLVATLARDARLRVHTADALELDLAAFAGRYGGRMRIVGNLPYNISTPLLFHLINQSEALEDLHVMLQREVVARIVAQPGSAAYGRLTVMLAPRVRAERLFDIGPGAFQPPPKVWSSFLHLSVLAAPAFAVRPAYASVVATAFSHRRKTLRNALRPLLSAAQIERCGVDPGARPGTLTPLEFNALAGAVAGPGAAQSPSEPVIG